MTKRGQPRSHPAAFSPRTPALAIVARRRIAAVVTLGGVLGLGACAVGPPSGPTVMALPGKGKGLHAFREDDDTCRGYAAQRIGYRQPGQARINAAIGSAAVGTALGAAAGAALGTAAGNPGAGAAIGGATGLLGGSAVGATNAAANGADLQQRYDVAYTQCMYARGDTVRSPPRDYGYSGYSPLGYGYPPSYSSYFEPGYSWGFWPRFSLGIGDGDFDDRRDFDHDFDDRRDRR